MRCRARQDEMAPQSSLPQSNRGEGHPDLKGDPGLLWNYDDRPTGANALDEGPVERPHGRRSPAKVVGQLVPATRMGLGPIREASAALGAFPEGSVRESVGHASPGTD